MSVKALVIDDDPQICEAVGNVLASLGHEQVSAGSQEDARRLLADAPYAYILLDLDIPVRANGGFERLVNGENLLNEIHAHPLTRETPVIVMTAYGTDGPALAVRLMKNGAVDFVNKPFDGDQLDRAILEALDGYSLLSEPTTADRPSFPVRRPFTGGELVVYEDRIALCGVTIMEKTSRGHGWMILLALAEVREHGRRSFSAHHLAKQLGGRIGDKSVIQSIRSLRRRIAEVLATAGFDCSDNDVILSRAQGYRLASTITVRTGQAGATTDKGALNAPPVVTASPSDADLNERQLWILAELRQAGRLCRCDVERHCRCSGRTAKRDLAALHAKGLIEFVSCPRPGHYRLTQPA